MDIHVDRAVNKLQIVYPVVKHISVLVVNYLGILETPTKILSHYQAVLKNIILRCRHRIIRAIRVNLYLLIASSDRYTAFPAGVFLSRVRSPHLCQRGFFVSMSYIAQTERFTLNKICTSIAKTTIGDTESKPYPPLLATPFAWMKHKIGCRWVFANLVSLSYLSQRHNKSVPYWGQNVNG